VMRTRRPEDARHEFVFPDGRHGWFELRIEAVPCGLCVVSLDVTDQHTLEMQLRESQMRTTFALGAAHMGIWQLRLSTGDMYFSETIADLVGVDPTQGPDTMDGFLDWVDERDRDAVRRAVDDAVTGRVTEFFVEFRITRRSDGRLRWMAGQGRIVADQNGKPDLLLGVGIDITDRREAERHLRHAQKLEAIGRLAGGIAHDFNNQLTAILGFCDMAMVGAAPGSRLTLDLEEIRRAAERSASLTKQLLAFSRQQVLTIEPLDLNDVVLRVVCMLERLLGPNTCCECHCGVAPIFIQGDAGQLEHVLTNLAINARDAMPDGGTLTIGTELIDLKADEARSLSPTRAGRYGVLLVRDSGNGMDAATRARLFEPFFTTKSVGEGTGLGLSSVHGIVTQMGGIIRVESAVGQGTTFRIYFPLLGDGRIVDATRSDPR